MKSWRSILCLVLLSLSAASARRTTSSVKAVIANTSSKAKVNRKVSSAKPTKVAFKASSKNGGTTTATSNLMHRAKVGFYFGLWYALNIVYNIVNKKVLNVWPAPMTVGSLQLGVGALYSLTAWTTGLRARPVVGTGVVRATLRRVGFWHALGQLCTMMSLGAGPVSFTHIVKALEPFFSAMVSALLLGQWMPLPVYLTLLPVVGGVGYACLKERSFSWLAFGMAMLSNLSFALRAVLSKVAMTTAKEQTEATTENLTPPNVFGLVTLTAFVISVPLTIMGEGRKILPSLSAALEQQQAASLAQAVLLSGLFHYLNNEVMYLALGSVHPVTLAVGNTMKRVFIMVASVMVFHNVITTQAAVGSCVGIGGVLLYSLTKQYYDTR